MDYGGIGAGDVLWLLASSSCLVLAAGALFQLAHGCYNPKWRLALRALLLFLIAAFMWEAGYLYYEYKAEQDATIFLGMPAGCFRSNGWFSWLVHHLSWSKPEHECEEYHRKVNRNPLWQLNPLFIIGSVLARLFTFLLKNVTWAYSHSLSILLSQTPVQWQPLVVIVTFGSAFLLLAICCGCQFRAVYGLISIGPSPQQRSARGWLPSARTAAVKRKPRSTSKPKVVLALQES